MESRRPEVESRIRLLVEEGVMGEAVAVLLRAYGAELLGFLRGATGSGADADEVFCATSERVWRALPKFQWRCALRTWVYTVARNELSRFVRRERRHNVGRASSFELDEVIAYVRTSGHARSSERRSKIEALRAELPIDDRTLLILRIDRGLSWEEIAVVWLDEGDEVSRTELSSAELTRESARLRKRYQLVRQRLAERAREWGLLTR